MEVECGRLKEDSWQMLSVRRFPLNCPPPSPLAVSGLSHSGCIYFIPPTSLPDLTPRPASLATTGCLHASDLKDKVPSLPWIPSLEYLFSTFFQNICTCMKTSSVCTVGLSVFKTFFLNTEGHKSFKIWSIFE